MPVYNLAVVAPCSRRLRSPSSSRIRPIPRRRWSVRTLIFDLAHGVVVAADGAEGHAEHVLPVPGSPPTCRVGGVDKVLEGPFLSETGVRIRIDDRPPGRAVVAGSDRPRPYPGRKFTARLGQLLQIAQL